MSFAEEELGKITQFRQIFEAIGFLLSSIALAVIVNVNISLDAEQVISATAIILAITAFFFHLASSDQVIGTVAVMPAKELIVKQNTKDRIWDSLKEFFTTSIAAYFWLTSILLSTSNITMGLMSVITTAYLGIISNKDALWIGALGFPIGSRQK